MISGERKGKRHVKEQAHGSADDRGTKDPALLMMVRVALVNAKH